VADSNRQLVGKAIELLGDGLAPFVARECRAKYGQHWLSAVRRYNTRRGSARPPKANPDDPHFLLKAVWDEWNTIFGKKLSHIDRSYVSELRDARNRWAHGEKFSTDDALRDLDTVKRLLESVAAGAQANKVNKLREGLIRRKINEQARHNRRKVAAASVVGRPTAGLPAWRKVATPHEDIASGRYEMAEFAADLHQVWRGDATDEYGDPTEFYRRTFITEGLGNLIVGAVRRFTGAGGDPVIKLQTNFGGGKTHSLIALFHLTGAAGAGDLPGVEQLLAEHGLDMPKRPISRAVLVGHQLQPSSASTKRDGTVVRTMWGELAWQLGGAKGFKYVAEADRRGTSPGAALIDLLRSHSPCLILIDEWVAYARQLYGVSDLPAGSFDAHFSFAQALTDAARNTPGALLVATIPASDIEVGGEGGQLALTKLENLFSRMETTWRTASTEESFEIVRRRLFQTLEPDSARQRDAVVKAFSQLYRAQSGEFPYPCKEADYERRMKAAYPVHPELFDRLFGDWSELERFQRTRGVLRLMAKVIHSLWIDNDPSLLIMPATIPIGDNDVAAELIRYLDDGWRSVIEKDIDGPDSLALKLDKQNPNLARYSAARRIARTVYFGSAPSQEAANLGLDDRAIKLGCVQPGERPATFGDALRRLSDQATYLYRDRSRYWYSLQPTVTRTARDRASQFSEQDVDEVIRKYLDAVRSQKSHFAAVHACPRATVDVPDTDLARLVVLDPSAPHDTKTEHSAALDFAGKLLTERGTSSRRYCNMLVFLAADRSRLTDLRDAVRQWLAWDSIDRDRDSLRLDNFQVRQIEAKVKESQETVGHRVAETYQWLLNPSQPDHTPVGRVRWDAIRISGALPIAERAAKKMVAEETLIPAYSGTRLRLDIDRVPLWQGDHLEVDQLWKYYAKYLYLPRLVKRSVLEDAIRDGVGALTWETDGFAYTDGHDGSRYTGLRMGEQLAAVAPSGLLVKPDAALSQRAREQPPDPRNGTAGRLKQTGGRSSLTGVTGSTATDDTGEAAEAGPPLPTRYLGRVKLDTLRWTKTVAEIADAIVNQLARTDDTKLSVTIEVEADSAHGFDERVQRTVTENAATLKFDTTEFHEH